MSYSFYNDSVLAYWRDRPLIAKEAFAQMAAFLRRLQAFSDVFAQLYVSNTNTFRNPALRSDFSNLETELIAAVHPERGFINADDENFGFSMESRSTFGFGGSFYTVPKYSQVGCWIRVKCGCFDDSPRKAPDMVDITVSEKLATPEFLRGLLEQTVSFWRPADAVVTRAKIMSLVDQPVGDVTPGWLTYLADPEVASFVPADFAHAPMQDGIVIQAGEHPGREDDQVYVDGLMRLRDALRPHGSLSNRRALSLDVKSRS